MSKKNAKEFSDPSQLFQSKRRGQGLFGLLVHIMYLNAHLDRFSCPNITIFYYYIFFDIIFFMKIFLD
jgi:hypothetical protein